jgi:2-polyprenyl-6-hydroxyphenyl methylase/3-demethylubiquinone-9 3-methyltransferase
MNVDLLPISPQSVPCKICGATASLYGVVDFHKNCEIVRGRNVLPLSGIPIYYHRCPACRFIFTTAFDKFTSDDFRKHVYNDQYAMVDPDYAEVRPRANAAGLVKMFGASKPERLLDYGGGAGVLADSLRAASFSHADTYDPFVSQHAVKPAGRYDCVVSFEVVEHTPTPLATFREMDDVLAKPGLILFSTLVQPAEIEQVGLSWWYAAPRNGHVSLFSRQSLEHVARSMGLTFGSFNDNLHALFRELPDFAKHLVKPQ